MDDGLIIEIHNSRVGSRPSRLENTSFGNGNCPFIKGFDFIVFVKSRSRMVKSMFVYRIKQA